MILIINQVLSRVQSSFQSRFEVALSNFQSIFGNKDKVPLKLSQVFQVFKTTDVFYTFALQKRLKLL